MKENLCIHIKKHVKDHFSVQNYKKIKINANFFDKYLQSS